MPEHYAAFERRDSWGTAARHPGARQLLSVAACWATGLPLLRAGAVLHLLASVFLLCTLAKRLAWLQRRLPVLASLHARAMLFACGFHRVRVLGRREPGAHVFVSNHVSHCDILVAIAVARLPAFIAKDGVSRVPVVGRIASAMDCVFVQREREPASSGASSGAAAAVLARLRALHAPGRTAGSLWVFPEGTTTNNDFLLPFKTGAFLSGDAVQPVLLRYGGRRAFSPAYESIEAVRSLFLLLSQWSNQVEVLLLPLYRPSDEERANPALYAAGVRAVMLSAGGLQPSELTLADKRAYHAALREAMRSKQA